MCPDSTTSIWAQEIFISREGETGIAVGKAHLYLAHLSSILGIPYVYPGLPGVISAHRTRSINWVPLDIAQNKQKGKKLYVHDHFSSILNHFSNCTLEVLKIDFFLYFTQGRSYITTDCFNICSWMNYLITNIYW